MNATGSITDRPSPTVIGEIIMVDVDVIDPDPQGRIGQFFPLRAEGLACRIKAEGQNEAIKIVPAADPSDYAYVLVAGLHRLEACRMLGQPVLAIVVHGDADTLRKMQASENLDRREMAPLERSMFVAAVAEAAQGRLRQRHGDVGPQALGGKARAARVKMTPAAIERPESSSIDADEQAQAASGVLNETYGWRTEVQEACGLNVEALKRSLRIYRGLVEPHRELVERIKCHPIASNASALLALAGRPAPIRAAALAWLADHPEATTADAALVAIGALDSRGNRKADAEKGQQELMTRAASNLTKMTPSTWRNWAPDLAKKIKPSALIAVRDAINAEIAERGLDAGEKQQ